MSTTTPSHIETIREALEALRDDMRRKGWLDNYHLLASTLKALASLEALSRQPAQAHDIDKIMEVVIQAIEDNDNVEWKSPPASYNTERDKLIRSRLIKHMNS